MYLRLRLGRLMKDRGISEAGLSKQAGVARNTVRSLARNANTRVDFEVIEKIAAAMGVRPLELFEETETPRGPLVAAPAW
jgi:putative transcriptional regulator